jgi:hypothetical protein
MTDDIREHTLLHREEVRNVACMLIVGIDLDQIPSAISTTTSCQHARNVRVDLYARPHRTSVERVMEWTTCLPRKRAHEFECDLAKNTTWTTSSIRNAVDRTTFV